MESQHSYDTWISSMQCGISGKVDGRQKTSARTTEIVRSQTGGVLGQVLSTSGIHEFPKGLYLWGHWMLRKEQRLLDCKIRNTWTHCWAVWPWFMHIASLYIHFLIQDHRERLNAYGSWCVGSTRPPLPIYHCWTCLSPKAIPCLMDKRLCRWKTMLEKWDSLSRSH